MAGRLRARLSLDSLEHRALPAGNVSAVIHGVDLVLRGDTFDNSIRLDRLPTGVLQVRGRDGTTINGQPTFDASAAIRDVDARLQQGGTDRFEIQGAFDLAGHLDVRLGAGDVLLEGSTGPVTLRDDLRIQTGGPGVVTIRNEVHVFGKTEIDSAGSVTLAAGRATLPRFAAAVFSKSLTINNPYFPLVQGAKFKYDVTEGGQLTEKIVVDVPAQTKTILGIETQLVRDRVFRTDGQLREDTLDYYAQDDAGNVWYLGEQVTNYLYDDQGHPIGTTSGGTWEAGVGGAVAGIIMEAAPKVGDRYYQEFNANDVLDQAAVLARGESAAVPKGNFANVLRTRDTSVLEPTGLKDKRYAPGIGIVEEIGYDYITGEISELTQLTSLTLNGTEVSQIVSPTGFRGTNVGGRAVGGIRMDDEAEIDANGLVTVLGASFGDSLDVLGTTDVSVAESRLSGPSQIGTEGVVGLRDALVRSRLDIAGAESAYILGTRARSLVQVTLGDGDSTLAVKNSVLPRLSAEGGLGINTFDDKGGNTIRRLRLSHFQ